MVEFQARKRLRKIIYSPVLLGTLFIALLFLSHATYSLLQKYHDAKDTASILLNEKNNLSSKIEGLEARVSALKTDRGVEEAIREKFKVAKTGEGVVVVVDQNKEGSNIEEPKSGINWFFDKISSFFK